MTTIALLAALDTKHEDAELIASRLGEHGHTVLLVDTGVLGQPGLAADVTREQVATAGGDSLAALLAHEDRANAVRVMGRGTQRLVADLHGQGAIDGVMGLGGGAGTTIASQAMQHLPLGFPKVILTTVAAGDTTGYLGTSDIVLFPSIVDVAGVNRISSITYRQAADALSGMVHGRQSGHDRPPSTGRRPTIAATMFGVTTDCVTHARARLEQAGFEVLVFHATGNGGRTMERLIEEGLIDGVLDLTTTELADELVGGILTAGPHRLEAAGRAGVPQVVSLGATDMVNFGPVGSLPPQYAARRLYEHNPQNTLMRVSEDEAGHLGRLLARKLNLATGPTHLLVPTHGVSALDRAGQPFDDPDARAALVRGLEDTIDRTTVAVESQDLHINDPAFAERAVELLLQVLDTAAPQPDLARGSTR